MSKVLDTCHAGLDEGLRSDWKEVVIYYCTTMKLLRARHHFDEVRVLEFQESADKFYDLWLKLCGRDGVGNYMHSLGAGHVGEQLQKFGNLYRYSQQGWEAVNKKVKKVFFNQTSMGGGWHGGSSKIKPIMYLFLREVLEVWMGR